MGANGQLKRPRTVEEVRADLERARSQVVNSALAIRQEVALRTDWRAWVRQRPALCLAGAALIGFLIGSRRPR